MTSKAPVALAIGAGYFLGKTHKLRWALALGAAAATGRLNSISGDLVKRGTDVLGASPELAKIGASAEQLLTAGKSAALAAMNSRMESISDALTEKAPDALKEKAPQAVEAPVEELKKRTGRRREEPAEEPEDEYDEEEDEYDEEEDEYEEDENGEDEDEGDEEPQPSRGGRRPEPVVRRTGEKAGRRS